MVLKLSQERCSSGVDLSLEEFFSPPADEMLHRFSLFSLCDALGSADCLATVKVGSLCKRSSFFALKEAQFVVVEVEEGP